MSPAPPVSAVPSVAAAVAGSVSLALALRRRWLTGSGAAAALAVGGVVLLAGGAAALLLLLLFFITTSLLTGASARRRNASAAGGDHRGRSAPQVVANGGVPAVCALLAAAAVPWAAPALAGAVAAAAADSWGTEVGTAVGGPTWLPDGRRVRPGRSGGLSAAGSAAAVVAAALVGAAAVGLTRGGLFATPHFLPIFVGGVGGMLADSALGAWVEGRVPWVGNQTVNLAATAAGAALAAGLS